MFSSNFMQKGYAIFCFGTTKNTNYTKLNDSASDFHQDFSRYLAEIKSLFHDLLFRHRKIC